MPCTIAPTDAAMERAARAVAESPAVARLVEALDGVVEVVEPSPPDTSEGAPPDQE